MRVAFVQYAGDFREAVARLRSGGAENYRAQRYTVEYVENLVDRVDAVATITGFTDEKYDETLSSGGRVIGLGFRDRFDAAQVSEAIQRFNPTHVVLRTPQVALLKYVANSKIPTLALLADSFPNASLRDRIKRFLSVWYLNRATIQRVANHGRTAARQLVNSGVRKEKVIAWDYPQFASPAQRLAKPGVSGRDIVYVGPLTEAKGVVDLLDASSRLAANGCPVNLHYYGKGDVDWLRALAKDRGIDGSTRLHGQVPNAQVIEAMAAADVVVVPSRHEYPEGLPLTIYEALCSRTPLVVSDHPMFVDCLKHNESAMIFPAGNSAALAESIRMLLQDRSLYQKLSEASDAAWAAIQIETKWHMVIDDWLFGASRV